MPPRAATFKPRYPGRIFSNLGNIQASGAANASLNSANDLLRRYLLWTLAAGSLLLGSDAAGAEVRTATSPSRADVGAAYAACSNGDTLIIPAGSATWTTGLVITKAITIQGAGIGSTIITDGMSAYDHLFNISLVANQTTRLTRLEIIDDGVRNELPNRVRVSGTNIDNRRIRIDNCKFNSLDGGCFQLWSCLGVIDHNTIVGKVAGQQVFIGFVFGSSWGSAQDTPKWGDGAWAAPDNFGTDQFIFFENNTITNLYPFNLTGIDGHSGARYVFRHNVCQGAHMAMHGSEAARARSGRAYEIYSNTFTDNGTGSTPLYMRGGVGVVHNNTCNGYARNAQFALLQFRLHASHFHPIGSSDGRNPWDTNDPANPYASGTATSSGTLTVTDSSKSWLPNQWANHTIRRTSGKAVTAASRSGNTYSIRSPGHGFKVGDRVSIFGANEAGWNGLFSVESVPNSDVFTFTTNFQSVSPATGTLKCCRGNHFSLITSNTADTLTFSAEMHGSEFDLAFAASDTFEINRVLFSMDQPGAGQTGDLAGADLPVRPVGWGAQSISPWYEWNNTRDGADVDFGNQSGATYYSSIVQGTHFFNDMPKPGYTPYLYPHPLVSGVSNDPPTLTSLDDRTMSVGGTSGAMNFTVADSETAVGSLVVSGVSSNPTLVPTTSIVFGGSGASRTVTVTPAPGQSGTATIIVTVSDGTLSASDTFLLTVNATAAVNTPPTISRLTVARGGMKFTVGDTETPAANLIVSGASSNPALVSESNIVFGGSDADRTVTVTPAPDQAGTATITVTVTDGVGSASASFYLSVNAVNEPPTVSDIAHHAIAEDASTGPLAFTVGDGQTEAGSLTVSTTSSNPAVVPAAGIVLGGSGANRTVTVTPTANASGTATVTLNVNDGELNTSKMFNVTVSPVNDAPTISNLSAYTTSIGTSTGPFPFTVADAETPASTLTVTGGSSNPTLVPNQAIVFGGSGAARTVTVTPAPGQTGTATIALGVSDDQLSSGTSFELTVSGGGLVAAYAFGEGAGTTVTDASGTGNNGTLLGATWSASGKFGGALAFNGASRVVVPGASSLDFATRSGLTFEAWVYPNAQAAGWSPVMVKEIPGDLVYALHAASPENRTVAQIVTTAGKAVVEGPAALPLLAWSHLAVTYDGAVMRFHVNGIQVASRPTTGALVTSTGALSIGGETIWGGYFRGLLDEIRIYSRTLSPAEIQSDMITPIGTMALNTPPVVAITSPASGVSVATGSTISFAATAADTQDGNRTSGLIWTSNVSGAIGAGGSFSTMLPEGSHIITATVVDSGGLTGTSTVSIRVRAAPKPPKGLRLTATP